MPEKVPSAIQSEWPDIIKSVKGLLGFFAVIVLAMVAVFTVLAQRTTGTALLLVTMAFAMLFLVLIAAVAYLAIKSPDSLFRTTQASSEGGLAALETFHRSVSGYWWEYITPDDSSAISLVEISVIEPAGMLKLNGISFDLSGKKAATWESLASCANVGEKKVFYYWIGRHPSRPNDPYEGFGEIRFSGSERHFRLATGFFSDTNLLDMTSTTRKETAFKRITPRGKKGEREEWEVASDETEEAARFIREKLAGTAVPIPLP